METIGFLELNSISQGIRAADAMLKAAEIQLLFARPGCPGKYYILVSGEVAAIQASMDVGVKEGGACVLDRVVLPRVHPQVIAAIRMSTIFEQVNAVGVLEYFSVTAAIQGADAAVKAADITLIEVRLGTGIGGKSYVIMTGDVSAVEAAASAGVREASQCGMLVGQVVIPNPHRELFESLY